MAYKLVSVRLNDYALGKLDRLARYFSPGGPGGPKLEGWAPPGHAATRSDMIRAAVDGWLADHAYAVDKMLAELGEGDGSGGGSDGGQPHDLPDPG
jgi:hypothetical protein